MATKKKIPKNVSNLVYNMKDLIDKIKSRQLSQIFTNPVDEKLDYAPNYYNVIKKPMCLNDMMVTLLLPLLSQGQTQGQGLHPAY